MDMLSCSQHLKDIHERFVIICNVRFVWQHQLLLDSFWFILQVIEGLSLFPHCCRQCVSTGGAHLVVLLWCHGVLPYRYYVAEGVKLYSQETWRLVTEGKGVRMVEENISAVVRRASLFIFSQFLILFHLSLVGSVLC